MQYYLKHLLQNSIFHLHSFSAYTNNKLIFIQYLLCVHTMYVERYSRIISFSPHTSYEVGIIIIILQMKT